MGVITKERRKAPRIKLDWPVHIWCDSTNKFYTGRSINISSTGVLITLPLRVPIKVNDRISINFPQPEGEKDYEERIFTGKVVRVNRGASILDGYQSVALNFE